MNTSATPPTFNLKAVVQETGIKPHTLRVWEQRYGLPRPHRTSGNHRIYTQQDIEIVKWLMARQDEGMTISRAIELWHHLADKAREESPELVEQADNIPISSGVNDALANMRQKWIEQCLKFDKAAAESVLTQAFAIYPIQMVCLEILQKGLRQVGALWFQNTATVQQEHFISALVVERLNALLAAAPPPTRIGRILVFCPPYEEHSIPLLLLSLLLRYRGWDVIYLGANVPVSQLESTLEVVKPELVIVAAQRLQTAANLAKTAQFLYGKGLSTAYGGSIFNLIPELRQRVYGHFLGESLEEAVTAVAQIMAFNPPITKIQPIPDTYEQASLRYRIKRNLIELDTLQTLGSEHTFLEHVDKTNSRLAQDILAALHLGNLNFINPEMKLSQKLMTNYGISLGWQSTYFEAYLQAAQKNLNASGSPIIEWLDTVKSDLLLTTS